VFDLFHIGHLNILKRAKEQCNFLIVGVSTDELVEQEKHKKPAILFQDRFEIINAIRYVDKVVPQENMNKLEAYFDHKFNCIFVGDDWKGTDRWARIESDFKQYNVDIVYFPRTTGISSTILSLKLDKRK
jgi:glycerol-3-phosphate cytidylyltransferase